jgi:hypothetical protein
MTDIGGLITIGDLKDRLCFVLKMWGKVYEKSSKFHLL